MDQLLSAWNLILFIIGFGSLIFVHELGHFLVAKWVGIKATAFAIGFGQAILCYRKGLGFRVGTTEPEYERRIEQYVREQRDKQGREDDKAEVTPAEIEEAEQALGLGETEYRLNWIPFGGYVKMVGQEDLDPNATSDNPRSFNRKPIWARMCVISAGVIMNVIFAVLFFMVAFMIGVAFPPAIVGDVAPGSPAATATAVNAQDIVGLKSGDRVVAVNGEPTTDFIDLRIASALGERDQKIRLDVERPQLDGPPQQLQFVVTPVVDEDEKLLHIGVMPAADLTLTDEPGFAAHLNDMGLEPGMRMVAVNGEPVQEHWEYQRRFEAAEGRPLELTFEQPAERDEQARRRTITLTPETQYMEGDGGRHLLGLQPATRIVQVAGDKVPAAGVLEAGDVVRSVDGESYPSPGDFRRTVEAAGNEPISITVLRDGETVSTDITPTDGQLGVVLGLAENRIHRVAAGTPFAELELPAGTRIVTLDGEPVDSLSHLRRLIQQADEDQQTFSVDYQLPVGNIVETAQVTISQADRAELAELGWADNLPFVPQLLPQTASNPAEAVWMGVKKTNSFMIQTYITIDRLFGGTVRVEHLRGPVGIVESGTQFSERGFGYLMFFLGLISINLAVINFLPLPIVDGGLALLLLWEKIRGKPAPPEVQQALTVVGLLLIGALFITVTYHDFARLLGG